MRYSRTGKNKNGDKLPLECKGSLAQIYGNLQQQLLVPQELAAGAAHACCEHALRA
jgi:hypothetical protein